MMGTSKLYRNIDQDIADADAMRRRREKQRRYSATNRKKLIVRGIPERDAIEAALLVAVLPFLVRAVKKPDDLERLRFMKTTLNHLEERDANREATKGAIFRMICRWKDADEREKREAELEAAYQAKLAERLM
jgi:hypothetical protein